VFDLAYKLTSSRGRAKEVVQDVFLKVWNRRAELRSIENFGAYLNRMARNQSIDALRVIAREALRLVELREEELEKSDWTTVEALDYKDTGRVVSMALAGLSPQQRRVYRLCHEQGMKYEEAALELGLSPGTVHSHMKQALKHIRFYLRGMDALLLLAVFWHR
jgi:RNA polymerase sigma-70 factor (ECF subfamily)